MFPRIEPRKRRVLALPRTPKTGVVDHSFLSERHGSTNAHGTAQERRRLNGGTLSAFPPPLRWTPSRGHATFLSLSPTEERQKPLDFQSKRSVTCTSACLQVSSEQREDTHLKGAGRHPVIPPIPLSHIRLSCISMKRASPHAEHSTKGHV